MTMPQFHNVKLMKGQTQSQTHTQTQSQTQSQTQTQSHTQSQSQCVESWCMINMGHGMSNDMMMIAISGILPCPYYVCNYLLQDTSM